MQLIKSKKNEQKENEDDYEKPEKSVYQANGEEDEWS